MNLTNMLVKGVSALKYTVGDVVAVAAIPLMCSRVRKVKAERILFLIAAVALLIRSAWRMTANPVSWDLLILRMAGEMALSGRSPYDNPMMVAPPSSLPLYELFAMVDLLTMHRIWVVANTIMLLVLPYACWRMLVSLGPEEARRTGPFPFAAGACLLLSTASLYGLDAGQMQLLTTLLLVAALQLKTQGRPFLAGLSLAMAMMKVAMVVPLLSQFCDRKGWKAWVGLLVGVVVLMAIGSPLGQIPTLLRQNLANLVQTSRPGGFNDIAFENRLSDDLVSIARWLYCLGVRDRGVIALLELGILGAMGLALTVGSVTGRLAADAAAAAALGMGSFFLYHRMYDSVILAVPLIYCAAASRRAEGLRRVAFLASVVGILAVMNMPRGPQFAKLSQWTLTAGTTGRLVQIFVLPYAVWILLGVTIVIGLASDRPGSQSRPVNPE